MAERACAGGQVLDCGHMAECALCGMRVRWDMQDHHFWGWHNCPHAPRRGDGGSKPSEAVPPSKSKSTTAPILLDDQTRKAGA